MILEAVSALVVVILGVPFAALAGLRGWGLAAGAPLLGAFLYVNVGAMQVVLYLPTYPLLTVVLSTAIAAAVGYRARHAVAEALVPIAAAAAVAATIAITSDALTLVKWTADSMVYLAVGGLLASDQYHAIPAPDIALERLIGVGLLHAPAHLGGAIALVGITPVMAASALATAVWMLRIGASGRVPARDLTVATAILIALPLAANRMVFTAFYINGHVMIGGAVLLVTGAAWLVAAGRAPSGLLAVSALAIPAAVVTRPDAAALLAVVLVGVIADVRVRPNDRALLVGTLALSMLGWNTFLASVYVGVGEHVPLEVWAQVAGGVVLLCLAVVVRRPLSAAACARVMRWSASGLALATLAAIALRPEVAARSVYATFVNLAYRGGWAPFLALLIVAVLAAVWLFALPEVRALRFAVMSFPAVALILAVVRDGAYRVGPGDSLNRSWAHIVPTAILLVVATVLLGRLRRSSELALDGDGTQPLMSDSDVDRS